MREGERQREGERGTERERGRERVRVRGGGRGRGSEGMRERKETAIETEDWSAFEKRRMELATLLVLICVSLSLLSVFLSLRLRRSMF